MCTEALILERLTKASKTIKAIAEEQNEVANYSTSSSSYSSVSSDGLRERLFSFSGPKWKIKPREISLRSLAQHGWYCLDADILQCVNCRRYMNVSLPPLEKVDIAVFNATIRKINKQMIEGHDSTCAMRNTNAQLTSSLDSASYRKKIAKRFETMKRLDLDCVNVGALDEENKARLSLLCLDDDKIATLASLGWHKSEVIGDTITCDYCKRNVGLWLFRNEKELNGEDEHCRWCAYVEVFRDGSVAWERHLATATEFASRKRKLPVTVELEEKTRVYDGLISPFIRRKQMNKSKVIN